MKDERPAHPSFGSRPNQIHTDNLYLKEHGRTHSGADITDKDNPHSTASQTEQSFLQKKQERNIEKERKPGSNENFPDAVNAKPSQTEKSLLDNNQIRDTEKGHIGNERFVDAVNAKPSQTEKSFLRDNQVRNIEKGRNSTESFMYADTAKASPTNKSVLEQNKVNDTEKGRNDNKSFMDADNAKPPPTEKSLQENIPVRGTEKASNGSERSENAVNANPSQNEISFLQNHQQRDAEKVQDVHDTLVNAKPSQTETSFLNDRYILERNKDMTGSKHSQTTIKQDTVPMAKIRYPTHFNHEQQSSVQTEDQPAAVSQSSYHTVATKSQPTLHMNSSSCTCIGPGSKFETKVPSPLAAASTEQHTTSAGYSDATTANKRVPSEYNSIPETLDATRSCQTETCIGYNIYSTNDTTTELKDPEIDPREQLLEQKQLSKLCEPNDCLGYKAPLQNSQSHLTKDPREPQTTSTAYSEAIAPCPRLRSEYHSIPEALDATRSNQTETCRGYNFNSVNDTTTGPQDTEICPREKSQDQTRFAESSEPNICIGYNTESDYISKAQFQCPHTKSCYCTPKQSQKLSIGEATEASGSRSMLVQKTCYCQPEDLKMVSHQVTRKSLEQKSEQRSLRKSKISCVCLKPSKTKSERSKSTQEKKSAIFNLKKNDQFQDCDSSSSNTSIPYTSKASKPISWMDDISKLPKSVSCYCASGNLSDIKQKSSKHYKQKPEIGEEDLCTCNSKTFKNDTSMPSGVPKDEENLYDLKSATINDEKNENSHCYHAVDSCYRSARSITGYDVGQDALTQKLSENDGCECYDAMIEQSNQKDEENLYDLKSATINDEKNENSHCYHAVDSCYRSARSITGDDVGQDALTQKLSEDDGCECYDAIIEQSNQKDEENLYDLKSATLNDENNENSHCYLAVDNCYRSARSITGDDVGQDALTQKLSEDDGCECYDEMIEQRLQELTMLLRIKVKESEKKSQTQQISFEECIEAARNQPNEVSNSQSKMQHKRQERLEKKHQDLQKCLGITKKTQEPIEIYNVEFDKGFEAGGEDSFYDDIDEDDDDDDVASQFTVEANLDDDEFFVDCYSPTQTAEESQICEVSEEDKSEKKETEVVPKGEPLPKEKVKEVISEEEPPPMKKQEPQPEESVKKVNPENESLPKKNIKEVSPEKESPSKEKVKEVSSVQALVKPSPCPTPCICCHCRALECDNACKSVTKTLDAVLCDPSGEMKYFIDSIICDLNAMDHVLCKKEVKPKPFKNQGTVGLCPRDSFPVTISDVSSLGCAALYLRWEIEDCSGIAGYEIYVDGHLTNRFYSYRHKAGVATNVDVTKSHQIVLRAHPIGQDFAGDSCRYASQFTPYPELKAGATRPWSPSVFFYDPIQPSDPHTSQVPSQNQMAVSGSPPA